jgi:glutamine phosphoribosylpyrophosphate amidotransferase
MRSRKEFIARDKNGAIKTWKQIADEIHADSLEYISMNGLKEAIGMNICKGCIDFPKGYPPEMQEQVTQLFAHDKKGTRAYECLKT